MFINLLTRSYYSMTISSISIDEIVNFALANNQQYVSLIDINVMYGAVEFYNKATAAGLKPVIGLSTSIDDNEVILIAKNYDGYTKLCQISSAINHNNQFKLTDYKCDDLILISANKIDGFNNQYRPNQLAIHEALFTFKEDYEKYKALYALNKQILLSEVNDDHVIAGKHLLDENSSKQMFSLDQIELTNKLVETINLQLPLNKTNHFVKFDKNHDSYDLLRERCRQGLIKRFGLKVEKKYIDRINYELEIIHKMGFDDYFLVVQDYVAYAKQNNIAVGPGRGSAAGSLVSYVLCITDLDPLRYGLIFERFLNSQRQTMPDIDIDFMDNRRQEVFDYIFNKYGHDHVAHIITFQKIKIKTAIRDIGRILGIDLSVINMICKNISDWFDTDINTVAAEKETIKAFKEKYPKLFELAEFIMGMPRQIGTHAAGVVICNEPIANIVPTTLSAEGINTTQYSMEYIEPCGLIKMDILGLVNLSIINDCVDEINKTANNKFDINNISLDDQKVFKQLSDGNTLGIFQLESPGMTRVVQQIRPQCIEDISVASALFRPGPQANIPTYVKYRRNPESVQYIAEQLKPILSDTYGIIIYQEQVIQTLCLIANWSLAQADIVRRAISKKNEEKLVSIKKDFIAAAIKNGYSQEKADKIFEYIYKFASYGFNHSHSICYALISYQLAYLKTYYPSEFYACLLTYNNGATAKINVYLKEAKRNGINIIQPSINNSKVGFSLYKKNIIFGFSCLKGVGVEAIKKILKAKAKAGPFKTLNEAFQALCNEGVGQSIIEILTKAGCFDELFNDEVKNRTSLLASLDSVYSSFKNTTSKYGKIGATVYTSLSANEQVEKQDQAAILGLSLDKHPVATIKEANPEDYKTCFSLNYIVQEGITNNKYNTLVYINSIRKFKTKTGISMAWVNLEDESMIVTDAVCFKNIIDDPIQSVMFDKQRILLLEVTKTSKSIKINKIIKEIK